MEGGAGGQSYLFYTNLYTNVPCESTSRTTFEPDPLFRQVKVLAYADDDKVCSCRVIEGIRAQRSLFPPYSGNAP